MRLALTLIVAALLALAAGCGSDDGNGGQAAETEPAPPEAPQAELDFAVNLEEGERDRFSITCDEEIEPELFRFCENLDVLREIASVDRTEQVCTQLYGGPETARVTGTALDEEVDLRLSRENGCRIAEWQTVFGLLGKPYAGGEPGTTPPEPVD